ncbi:eukaryotic translation initiation factor 3 subunit A-like protein, partial [Tanacetum coccineum]
LINVRQKQDALQLLHDLITSKRYRAWHKTHENIVFKYIKLICVNVQEERKPAPRIQQQLRLRAERKHSFHPKRILKMMVVPSKRYMHAAAFLRWAVAANYHSRCGERSYSKETNCLDDAAFANTLI